MKWRSLRQWPWVTIATLIALAIAALVVPVSLPTGDDINVPKGEMPQPVGALTTNIAVTQQFLATGTAIRSVAMQFGTYRRTNPGALQVSVLAYQDAQWRVLATQSLPTQTLGDNEFATITFNPPLPVTTDQRIRLTVQSDADQARAVTWWVNPDYAPAGYTLLINDKPERGTARFAMTFAPRQGPVIAMLGSVIGRASILLNTGQRTALILAMAVLLAGILTFGRRLPDASPVAPVVDRDIDSDGEGAILRTIDTKRTRARRSEQEGQG